MDISSKLNQTITKWQMESINPDSSRTYQQAETFQGRWQDEMEEVEDANGQKYISKAIVYSDHKIKIDTYLFLGQGSGFIPLTEARRVIQCKMSPSVQATQSLYKSWLV